MVMQGLASARNMAPGRRLLSSRGGKSALLLPDSRPPASLTRSIKYAVERVSEHQRPTSTAYSTAATAPPAESSAASRWRQVTLGRSAKICWNNGSRPNSRVGCLLPVGNDEVRRGMWSSSGMQQELPATGAGRAFLLSSPPWAMQVAGLMTTASGAGGNSTGSDKRGKSQMGASSTSSSPASSTAGEAGASCTQPTTAEAPAPAAASQEFARGALSEEQATRDQQEADKANYAGEGGKGTADGGPTGERGAELPSGGGDVDAPRMTEIRDRLMDAQLDAREDARDWIKDKRDDMNTMQETLRDARREGRLREELSDQAKESRGRLRGLWRKYGAVGIGCYFGIYFGSIAFFYGVYDYGVMTNLPSGGAAVIERMQEWMKNTPEWAHHYSDRLFGAMAEDHRARSFVLAWATCKVLEPLRLIACIGITPRVARALGRAPAKGVDDDDDDDLEGGGAGSATDESRGSGKGEGGGDRR